MKTSEAKKIYKIYGLADPRCPEVIRYVGCTSQRLAHRLKSHINNCFHGSNSKDLWVVSLIEEGLRPIIVHIETVLEDENWEGREKHYISSFSKDFPLLNRTIGGKGASGCKHSDETRKKSSLARIGKPVSEETRKKISLAHIGMVYSEETRKKISLAHIGKTASEETRKKLSLAHKGKPHSKEHTAKVSLAKTGKKMTEEQCARISASLKGRKNTHSMKPVRCIETGEAFESTSAASSFLGVTHGCVRVAVRKNYKCGGLHWEYILEDWV